MHFLDVLIALGALWVVATGAYLLVGMLVYMIRPPVSSQQADSGRG